MTKKEAIDILRNTAWLGTEADREKVEAAIKALDKDIDVPVTDTISRQDVMRMLTSLSYNQCKTQGEADVIDIAKTMVITMPSAQPDLQQTCNKLATDTISRQIILSYIDRIKNQGTGKEKSLDYLGKYVSKLPSVQPEPEIYWGYTPTHERPLADVEIVPRLRDIQKQIPGGSYAIDRAVEIIEAVTGRRTDDIQ